VHPVGEHRRRAITAARKPDQRIDHLPGCLRESPFRVWFEVAFAAAVPPPNSIDSTVRCRSNIHPFAIAVGGEQRAHGRRQHGPWITPRWLAAAMERKVRGIVSTRRLSLKTRGYRLSGIGPRECRSARSHYRTAAGNRSLQALQFRRILQRAG